MILETQIQTLIFSFFFGIFFSFLLTINYKMIYNTKKKYQITTTFVLVIGSVILYFLGIRKVNYGIFHPYSAFVIVIGFFVEHYLHQFIQKKIALIKKK